MKITEYIYRKTKKIDMNLRKYLTIKNAPKTIIDSMKYSVLAPGKRIRPILVMASCEAVGGSATSALSVACAIEFIHVFSLIHDDLPSMDNADYRRGWMSNHKKFGEDIAILAGDALNTLAFQIIANDKKLDKCLRISLIGIISKAIGVTGVVGGQVYDLEFEGKNINFSKLKMIHTMKTQSLIEAAVKCGAMIAGAPKSRINKLSKFAKHLGLAFQIVDDILDVEGKFDKLGKSVGSDIALKKTTYPVIFGLEQSKVLAKREADSAIKSIVDFGCRAEPLRMIARFAVERNY